MGAVNSSRHAAAVEEAEKESSSPITSYVVDHILNDEKMSSLSCSNKWSDYQVDFPSAENILSKQVQAFKQNTRAGRLESTPAKPVTLARMVEDLAAKVHASPSLQTKSMETKVTALKTLAAHLLAKRWEQVSRTTSEPVPRALAPRLSAPLVVAARISSGETVGTTSTITNESTKNESSDIGSSSSNGSTSIAVQSNQRGVLNVLSTQMEDACKSLSFEEAAKHVMDVASLPLTLAFVSTLLTMSKSYNISNNVMNLVNTTMKQFIPPPKNCSMVFGPFQDDTLLSSQHSAFTLSSGSNRTSYENSHSIIVWFIPNPIEEKSVSFSLLNSKKIEQLKCDIEWTKIGMGKVHIRFPSLNPPYDHPVLSHFVNGTIPGQPIQLRLDVKNGNFLSLYVDGVPLLPEDSRLTTFSTQLKDVLTFCSPTSKVWLRSTAKRREVEEEKDQEINGKGEKKDSKKK